MSRAHVPDQLVSAEQFVHVRLTADLSPGESAAGVIVVQEPDGSFVDTTMTTTVYDNYDRISGNGTQFGQNYGLSGEIFKVRYNNATSKLECVGSQGLHRWGKADGNVSKGGSGAISIWHAPTGGSCSGSDSGSNVTACAITAGVTSGDEVIVEYHPEMKSWVVHGSGTPSSSNMLTIAKCDTGQALLPGITTGKTFSVHTWNGASLVDATTNITVKDPLNCNCYLPGEYGYFQQDGSDYLPVGSFGLLRMAEADADIAINASGTSQFYENNTVGSVNLTAYNTFDGYHRKIKSGYDDRFFVYYDTTQSKWIIIPPPLAMIARARLSGALIPGGTPPSLNNFANMDYLRGSLGLNDPTRGSGDLRNRLDIAAKNGDDILLVRDMTETDYEKWVPIGAEKDTLEMSVDLEFDGTHIQRKKTTVYVQRSDSGEEWDSNIDTGLHS